jgi:hypothetical protein
VFNFGIYLPIKFFIISQKESKYESILNDVAKVVDFVDEVETVTTNVVIKFIYNE